MNQQQSFHQKSSKLMQMDPQENILKCCLEIQGNLLKIWKKKYLLLKQQERQLFIYKNEFYEKVHIQMDLFNGMFKLCWHGLKGKKYVFQIVENGTKQKIYTIGSSNEILLFQWFDLIKLAIQQDFSKESIEDNKDIINQEQTDTEQEFQDEEVEPLIEQQNNRWRISKLQNKFSPVFYDFLQNHDLNSLVDESQFYLVFAKQKLRILQHQKDLQKYKLIIHLPFCSYDVMQTLLDIKSCVNWNANVHQIKIQNYDRKNELIINEIRKSYGCFYKKREFSYIRCLFESQNQYFIVDKSVNKNLQNSGIIQENIQGNYKEGFMIIKPHQSIQNWSMLVYELSFSNNGLLMQSQEKSLCVQYLKQYLNLETYIIQKTFSQSYPYHIKFEPIKIKENKIKQQKEEFNINEEQFSSEENEIIKEDETPIVDIKIQCDQQLQLIEQNQHVKICCSNKFLLMQNKNDLKQNIQSEQGFYQYNKQFKISDDGGLEFINSSLLKAQKTVLAFMIKKMGANLLSGKSVLNVSFPVQVFDTKSFLERVADCFVYAPYFLEKAAIQNDPIEQIKNVLSFVISMLHLSIDQHKPFNPVIGETFQGWISGCPIYLEQVCHHPPVSNFLMYGRGYQIHGSWEMIANLHANSLTGKYRGITTIIFENNKNQINFTLPPCLIGNLSWGKRYVNYSGKCVIYNQQNGLICDLDFNPNKSNWFKKGILSNDSFGGHLVKVSSNISDQFSNREFILEFKGIPQKDVIDELGKFDGKWYQNLFFEQTLLWNLTDYIPYILQHEKNPLPSNSTFRKDLLLWKKQEQNLAQAEKDITENQQRRDKKLRIK